jgi:hypothetical protein
MRILPTLAIGASMIVATVAVAQQDAPVRGDRVVTRAQALAMAEQRFRAMDTDGNGVLSSVEQEAAQAGRGRGVMAGVATREEALARAGERFDRLDTNRDGKLERGERPRRGAATPGQHRGGARLSRLLGFDGVMTRQEMVDRATARFDRLDTNRDGKLERAELTARRGQMTAAK